MSTGSDADFTARPQLSDDVARVVRRRIFDGTYPAGEYLRLDQLAVDLGISVTPVREALLNLRGEGLLVQHPRRGFMVLEFTARDLADVANVQAYVGGELAARAAENISAEQLSELTAIQDRLERAYADTDPDRTGMLPFAFEDGFGFERYVDYLLDVPMYFVYREGTYHDVAGRSFRDFMAGKLEGFEGERPSMRDWGDHMTTVFPEVRLKKYLEMRGADGGPWNRLCALPALWVGLLYDDDAQNAAWDLVRNWSMESREQLRLDAPVKALAAEVEGRPLLEVAREVLAIAEAGLKKRAMPGTYTGDETEYLEPLHRTVESGRVPAEELLALYHGRWNGSVDPVYEEMAY